MGFGIKLKMMLKNHNMTIKELAEITGISINTLYSITKRDSENVRFDIYIKIAEALKIPLEELIDEEMISNLNIKFMEKTSDDMALINKNKDNDCDKKVQNLIQLYLELNDEGQKKVEEYANDILKIEKYQRKII